MDGDNEREKEGEKERARGNAKKKQTNKQTNNRRESGKKSGNGVLFFFFFDADFCFLSFLFLHGNASQSQPVREDGDRPPGNRDEGSFVSRFRLA